MSEEEARCLLMFDELQDLLRVDRLGNIGGRLVAKTILGEAINHVVTGHTVDVVFTGSSGFLLDAFKASSPVVGGRRAVYQVGHADKATVMKALGPEGMNYTTKEAELIWNTAGGKLRLLESFLHRRIDDVPKELKAIEDDAYKGLLSLLRRCDPGEKKAIIKVFQKMADNKKASLKDIPESLRSEQAIGETMYCSHTEELQFQSEAAKVAWKRLQAEPK
jgi:hypothetical protein